MIFIELTSIIRYSGNTPLLWKGKYHYTADLLVHWLGFCCFAYVELDRLSQVWSMPNQSNRRSAVQRKFTLWSKWVFFELLDSYNSFSWIFTTIIIRLTWTGVLSNVWCHNKVFSIKTLVPWFPWLALVLIDACKLSLNLTSNLQSNKTSRRGIWTMFFGLWDDHYA